MAASSGAFGKGAKPGATPEPAASDSDEMAAATGSKKSKSKSKKSKTKPKTKKPKVSTRRGKSKFTIQGSPFAGDSRFEWTLLAFLLVAILLVL